MKYLLLLALSVSLSSDVRSQENAIFGGGDGGGISRSCFVQENNNAIFGGGSGNTARMFCYFDQGKSFAGSVFLEGPYDPGSGLMTDDLRFASLIPSAEPYTALGLASGGGETTTAPVLAVTGNDAIVDWVLLELRDIDDSTIILHQRPALLQIDGDVVDTDGLAPVKIQTNVDSAYIAIRHRNHLGAMLAEPSKLLISGSTVFDFSDPSIAKYGTDAMKNIAGVDVLWAGNARLIGEGLKYTGQDNDRDPILVAIGGNVPTLIVTAYSQADCNMDGKVKYTGANNDRDIILVNIGGNIPTLVKNEQLP